MKLRGRVYRILLDIPLVKIVKSRYLFSTLFGMQNESVRNTSASSMIQLFSHRELNNYLLNI